MTFRVDPDQVGRVASLGVLRPAATAGARLIALWPLTDAGRLDNDAKYAENLQVRLTRLFATVMSGQEVTLPDAEFVYEGATSIPGRPQEIVDALLTANDACDAMDGCGLAEGDAAAGAAAAASVAEDLGTPWDGATRDGVADILSAVSGWAGAHALDGEKDGADGSADPADDGYEPSAAACRDVSERLAVALLACDAMMGLRADGQGTVSTRDALPVLLVVNELRERLGVPRLCMDAAQLRSLVDARRAAAAAGNPTVDALAGVVAPIAASEWERHRGDVLWDPEEAKRKAKEEDERKSREALAAKFAHVKDDPSKPHVEL